MWCKPFHSLEDMTNHTKCHTRLNQCPIKSRTLFSAAVKPFCLRRYRSSPMCNVLEAAAGKGDILILAAISLCPIKHGKAFLAISVWLYFSRQIPSRSCNPCSRCTALEHQYLGRVLLRKQQTQFFRDEAQHPCQTRILLLTENYLKNFNTRHRISQFSNSPPSHINHRSETGGGSWLARTQKICNTEDFNKNSEIHAGNKSCSGHFPASI